jgi:hypothetical protein
MRCQLMMLDADAQPPRVEARFADAGGRLVRILDKEPIFVDGHDPPGQGWVRGTELRRQGEGPEARVLVSLVLPDSLETAEGADTVEVWAKDLVEAG